MKRGLEYLLLIVLMLSVLGFLMSINNISISQEPIFASLFSQDREIFLNPPQQIEFRCSEDKRIIQKCEFSDGTECLTWEDLKECPLNKICNFRNNVVYCK